jgi:hypothetical protein
MRHFICPTCAPSRLARGVPAGSAPAQLVAQAGAAQRFAAAHPGARPRAVDVATIAAAANAHLHRAARATVEPMRLPQQPHACPLQKHWTTPGNTGIKTMHWPSMRLCSQRARGSVQEFARAFAFSAVRAQHSAVQILTAVRRARCASTHGLDHIEPFTPTR